MMWCGLLYSSRSCMKCFAQTCSDISLNTLFHVDIQTKNQQRWSFTLCCFPSACADLVPVVVPACCCICEGRGWPWGCSPEADGDCL
jgi:hypothetical protein